MVFLPLARVQKLSLNPFIFVVDYFWVRLGRISFFNKENNTATRCATTEFTTHNSIMTASMPQ